MSLKMKLCLGLASAGGLVVVGATCFTVYSSVKQFNLKKESFEMLKETTTFQELYNEDAAEYLESLNQAKLDYADAVLKANQGLISMEEFNKAQRDYDLAVAKYELSTQEYNTDEYLESVMQVMPESEPCAQKYKESQEMGEMTKNSVIGLCSGLIATVGGMGATAIVEIDERDRGGRYY